MACFVTIVSSVRELNVHCCDDIRKILKIKLLPYSTVCVRALVGELAFVLLSNLR